MVFSYEIKTRASAKTFVSFAEIENLITIFSLAMWLYRIEIQLFVYYILNFGINM